MITIEDVKEAYSDYLEEYNLSEDDYTFWEFFHDNYNRSYVLGL